MVYHRAINEEERQVFRTALLVSAMLMVLASTALGDAIGPDPTNCPAGSYGTSSHCGQECLPLPCKTDADCRNKRVCRATRLCVVKGERSPCGRVPESEMNKKYPFTAVEGRCPAKGKCGRGTCVEAKRCLKPSEASNPKPKPRAETKPAPVKDTPTPKPTRRKGCQVGDASGSAWVAALALLLLLRRRRR